MGGLAYSGFEVGEIANASVSCSNNSVNAPSNYTFSYQNLVDLSSGTRVTIKVPSSFNLTANNLNITVNGTIVYTNVIGTIVYPNITVALPADVPRGSSISITILVLNPQRTGATSSFAIYDSTSSGYGISKAESNLSISI